MPYVSQEDVHRAARELGDAGLDRIKQGWLLRWLFLKERHLGPGVTVTFTPEDCRDFGLRWVVVDAARTGDQKVFLPFAGKWFGWETPTTAWWRNTFHSQLKRESGSWSRPEKTGTGSELATTGAEMSRYIAGLREAIGGEVPLGALSVWRYRLDDLPNDLDEQGLAQRLVDELQFTAPELDAVFSDDGPAVKPFESEA
jgi:hypothetical protein